MLLDCRTIVFMSKDAADQKLRFQHCRLLNKYPPRYLLLVKELGEDYIDNLLRQMFCFFNDMLQKL